MKKLFISFLFVLRVYSGPVGTVDPTLDYSAPGNPIYALLRFTGVDPLNRVYASGYPTGSGSALIRFQPSGHRDPTFRIDNAGKFAFDQEKRVVVQFPNRFEGPGPISRYTLDGTLDPVFSSNLGVAMIRNFALSPDGKIYVVGGFVAGRFSLQTITRLNDDGSVDSSFEAGDGVNEGNAPTIDGLVVQSDGRVVVHGRFSNFSEVAVPQLIRFEKDGSIDRAFAPNFYSDASAGVDPSIRTIAIDSSDRIYIGGGFTVVDGAVRPGIARLSASGDLDKSYALTAAPPFYPYLRPQIAIQPPSQLIYLSLNKLLRLKDNSEIDATFDCSYTQSQGIDTYSTSIASIPNMGIVITGTGLYHGFSSAHGFVKIGNDGQPDRKFDPAGPDLDAAYGSVPRVKVSPNGSILLTGTFGGYGITSFGRAGIGRFSAQGDLDDFAIPAYRASIDSAIVLPDRKVMILGTLIPDPYSNSGSFGVWRCNVDGRFDTMFTATGLVRGSGGTRPGGSIVQLPDGTFLAAGNFGPDVGPVIKIGTNGGVLTFKSSLTGGGISATNLPDGRLLVVQDSPPFVAILQSSGVRDLSFDPSGITAFTSSVGPIDNYAAPITPRAVAYLQDETILLGGLFKPSLIKLDLTGKPVPGFVAAVDTTVEGIAVQQDGKILVCDRPATSTNSHVRRLNANGSVDPTFPIIGPGGLFTSVDVQANGDILVAGAFGQINGISRGNIVRLFGDSPIPFRLGVPSRNNHLTEIPVLSGWPHAISLEASSDALQWQSIGTNQFSGSPLTLSDFSTQALRFYRVKLVDN